MHSPLSLIPSIIPCNSIRRNLLFLQIEAFAEALHATSCVENTLLPGEERVTLGADIDLEHRPDAECLETVAAGTTYCGLDVIWMNSLFHSFAYSQIFTLWRRCVEDFASVSLCPPKECLSNVA